MTVVSNRLTPLDTWFLRNETATCPMHVGSVMVFEAPDDEHDHARLVEHISERIAGFPRYRQRVREVPGGLADPVWIDDPAFDVTYHVRRSALPQPGSLEQLEELVARIMPRLLDRDRPLWEVYLVEGLADGRFAIITKTHQALVDGETALDIAHLIVDDSRHEPPADTDPAPDPGAARLVLDASGPALAAALAALLVLTGARRGADPAAGAETQAGSREIEELDRLKARGLLDEAAYAGARAEAGRRLLAVSATTTPAAGARDRFWVLGGIGVTVAGALGLYVFTGSPGKYVSLKDTIRGFKMIVDGECDHIPEQAFYMVGGIEEAVEKANKMNAAA